MSTLQDFLDSAFAGSGAIQFQYDDGGRSDAGYKGNADDCVTRAIAIATQQDYQTVYDALNLLAQSERTGKRKVSSSREGVYRVTWEKYLVSLGWVRVNCMQIGQGCKVHLNASELPAGRLGVQVSRHLCAVVDGVIHDTHDPSRDGSRCVYGYYVNS